MLNTTAVRVGVCLAGAMVGVFLLVAVPGCQWGDGVALLPTDRLAAVEATLDDSVLSARIEAALLLSPVIGSTRMAVDVIQGATLLSGPADDPTQVELALFIVSNVPGVIRVESILVTRAQDRESGAGPRKAPDVAGARAGFALSGTPGPIEGPGAPQASPRRAEAVPLGRREATQRGYASPMSSV
ncbi:putative periplasmic or secreted lipoprotein [Acidovorax sp. CF316]|uniref:BON domain-containing protein n=1 Tax=Acidovorax sp. CF316 TaxID=1144317 RepID=UPI00026BD31E|nr:BON domain-containing protein [Acidovorax sp. CF316]EJE53682.1 putative periplasmic or secreted lipoprotein [Acidovorax sp. CF316]